MSEPRIPIKARPRIIKPLGILDVELVSGSKLMVARGGGAVNVGKRVGVVWGRKAAAKVGLMVGVVRGVAVGGGSRMGRNPGESDTRGA